MFSLDDEVVINKAQIKSLKTLFVKNRWAKPKSVGTASTQNTLYTEGVFIAPVANSMDGKGMDFKEPITKNWATLGRDKSKFVPKIVDGNLIPQDNPFARLGFVLASPILFLQEGMRTVTIDLSLANAPTNIGLLATTSEQTKYPFKIFFSGEKEWISVEKYSLVVDNQLLRFTIILDPTVEPVIHFNAENLKENYGTTEPVVKIEIDQTVKISLPTEGSQPTCCAERKTLGGNVEVSAYHFLKNVTVSSVKITVQVCGIKKNIIVQNDENLQDVSGLMYPFGTRPEVADFSIRNYDLVVSGVASLPRASIQEGSNFYIGSKEIFLKKWSQVNIRLNWKDKPADFKQIGRAHV